MKKNIDVVRYLQDNHIRFWSSGKNVKKGEINVRCFRCHDRSNHLRIKSKGFLSCWKCGDIGFFHELVRNVERCDKKQALERLKKYRTNEEIVVHQKRDYVQKDINSFVMPHGIDPYLHDIHKEYLAERGFDVDEISLKYNLHSCLNKNSRFKFRIIIPIFLNGIMVNFVGRDVTNRQDPKYKDCPEDLCVVPKRHLLYGLDDVEEGGTGILVEGPTDKWNIGDDVMATLTTNFTIEQANLIRKKNLKKLFLFYDNVLYDPNAQKKAEQLEKYLYFIPEIYYIELPEDIEDPGALPKDDVMALRREIF